MFSTIASWCLTAICLVASSSGFQFNPRARHHLATKPAFTNATAATLLPPPPVPQANPTFDLKGYLASKKIPVERTLQKSIVSTGPETGKLVDAMLYSLTAGGKRIRPVLCLAACEMISGSDEKAMPAAVALEMIHTMSLIHDDLPSMDDDDLRRGKPTNHVMFGEDTAILAGDALLCTAFQYVTENTKGVDSARLVDIILRLCRAIGVNGLAGGQVMDLECEARDDVELGELQWIHVHKTAVLLEVSVATGAIIGGATPEEVRACEKYAHNIGLAFQVADDILDVTASTEELGKTAGKDEDQDKATYVKLMGLEGARLEARRLAEEAKLALVPFGERATPLLAIADYIVQRKN